MNNEVIVGVIGSGTMGSGIAQIAATAGHKVVLYDNDKKAVKDSAEKLRKVLKRLVEKGTIDETASKGIIERIEYADEINAYKNCGLVIEAIVENPDIKKTVFREIETIAGNDCILATNTSSLSIASIAAACSNSTRVLGIHFFNPVPLMPLVEIIPAVQTSDSIVQRAKAIINKWGKTTVLAKDTPGFIVNRIARPFYGEAIRIYEEGIATIPTIDWAMKELGGFRMGPFELMDFIGNDINYKVTETVFEQFFYDPRYKPSFTQKRMVEANLLGRKTTQGYYNYGDAKENPKPNKNVTLGKKILARILAMLINEAADALLLNIATREDIDLAMTKGVNYPKGLLAWADELGIEKALHTLENLQAEYGEDRYRPSALIRKMVRDGKKFYSFR